MGVKRAEQCGKQCEKGMCCIGCDFKQGGGLLPKNVTFEKDYQGIEGVNHMNPWQKNIPGGRDSIAKAPGWELTCVSELQGDHGGWVDCVWARVTEGDIRGKIGLTGHISH